MIRGQGTWTLAGVAIAAASLTVGSCSRHPSSDTAPAPSSSPSSATGTSDWLGEVSGLVTVHDERGADTWDNCLVVGARGMVGPCASMPPVEPTPNVPRSITNEMGAMAACVIAHLPAPPDRSLSAAVEFAIQRGAVSARVRRDPDRMPALQACAREAAARCKAGETKDGVVLATVGVWYEAWCDHPPGDATDASHKLVVRDIKGERHVALYPAGRGYWLSRCNRRESWRLVPDGDGFKVHDARGGLAASARRTDAGFEVLDAGGRAVWIGKRGAAGIELGGRDGERLGVLRSADGGAAASVDRATGKPGWSIRGEGTEWVSEAVGASSMRVEGSGSPAALLALTWPGLTWPERAAAFSMLATSH
jgi:hypothetical protein